jgi:hypothetical protein
MKYLIFGFIIIMAYATIASVYIKLQQGKNNE